MTRRIRLGVLLFVAGAGCVANAEVADTAVDSDAALRAYNSANGLLNRGLHDLAAKEYRKFLQDNGHHAKASVARYGLGVCLYRLERYDEAVAELTQLRVEPQSPFAAESLAILGQCHLAKKRYVDSANAFEEVLRSHAGHDLADDAAATGRVR